MGSYKYVSIAGLIAALFWMADSLIHRFIYEGKGFELIPTDFNEYWMRILIVILIIGFGIYVDYSIKMRILWLEEKKKIIEDRAKEENKILRKFFHYVQYFESEVQRNGGFDGSTMQHLDSTLKKTQDRLDSLDDIGDLTGENKIIK